MFDELQNQKLLNVRMTNELLMDLNLPIIECNDIMSEQFDEELSFMLLWEVREFGFNPNINTQLKKLWLDKTQQFFQDENLL